MIEFNSILTHTTILPLTLTSNQGYGYEEMKLVSEAVSSYK